MTTTSGHVRNAVNQNQAKVNRKQYQSGVTMATAKNNLAILADFIKVNANNNELADWVDEQNGTIQLNVGEKENVRPEEQS